MLDHFLAMFDELKINKSYQFKNHISASQYLRAYKLVKDHLLDSSSILDWGIGEGHFSYFLLTQNKNVTGFTVEDECLLSDYLTKKFPEQFQFCQNKEAIKILPFEDQAFDAVVSIGVLEHVRETGGNEMESLSEIRRVLKPQGKFICFHLPNKYTWIEAVTRHMKSRYSHPYRYVEQNIVDMLKKTGFKKIESKRYGMLPRLVFRPIPNNLILTKLFNGIDDILSGLVPVICQNNYFVAQRID
jgi:ubiquinone/menaquinone biosynthesis C-methylase UbiE